MSRDSDLYFRVQARKIRFAWFLICLFAAGGVLTALGCLIRQGGFHL